MNVIDAKALVKRLDNVEIIHGVDLSVRSGEVLGLLGPNGSGKSTLLRMLATSSLPTSGELHFFGEPAKGFAVRRLIGYLSDSSAHYGELTGMENARLFARLQGLPLETAQEAIDRLFDYFDLTLDADKQVKNYSFGMRRKLAFIESILHEPPLLLLDEPNIGLDYSAEGKLHELIRGWAGEGKAVVLATNNVREAERVCDRVVFIHKGSIVADDTPTALMKRLGEGRKVTVELVEPVELAASTGEHVKAMQVAGQTITATVDASPFALVEVSTNVADAGGEIRRMEVSALDLGAVFMDFVGESVKW